MKTKTLIIGYIIGFISAISLTAIASLLYKAEDVQYTPNNEEWDVNSVGQALDDLKENYIGKSHFIGHEWIFSFNNSYGYLKLPVSGVYRLEVWGAQGGNGISNCNGGNGGYAKGDFYLSAKDEIYVVVGGAGTGGKQVAYAGGYNGGGSTSASTSSENAYNSSGGGATHMALNSYRGVLRSYASNQNEILIVAGGGGGGHYHANGMSVGGSGGGLQGGSPVNIKQGSSNCGLPTGGTQERGGTAPNSASQAGSFGLGGSYSGGYGAGGGGGWYGGGSGGNAGSCAYSGAGGSGHINTDHLVEGTDEMSNGVRTGNGYAKITLVSID